MQYARTSRPAPTTQRVVLHSHAKAQPRRSVSFAPETVTARQEGAGDAEARAVDECHRLDAVAERNVAALLKSSDTQRSLVNTNSLFSVGRPGSGDSRNDRVRAGSRSSRQELPVTRLLSRRGSQLASHARLVSASYATVNPSPSSRRPGSTSAVSRKRHQLMSYNNRTARRSTSISATPGGGRTTVPTVGSGRTKVPAAGDGGRTVLAGNGGGRTTVPPIGGSGTVCSIVGDGRGKRDVVSGCNGSAVSNNFRDSSVRRPHTLRSRPFVAKINDAFTRDMVRKDTSTPFGCGAKVSCPGSRMVSLSQGLDSESGASSAEAGHEAADLLMGELNSRGEQLRSRLDSMLKRQGKSCTRSISSSYPSISSSAQREEQRRSAVSKNRSPGMKRGQTNSCSNYSIRVSSSRNSVENSSSNTTFSHSRYARHVAPASLLRHASYLCLSIDTLTFKRDFVASTLSAPGSETMTVCLEYRLPLDPAVSPDPDGKGVRVGGQPMSTDMLIQYDCVRPVRLSSASVVRHWMSAHLQLVAVAVSRLPFFSASSSSSSGLSRRRYWTLAAGSLPLARLLASERLHLSCHVPLKLRCVRGEEAVVGGAAVRLRLGGESAEFATALSHWNRPTVQAEQASAEEEELPDEISCNDEDESEQSSDRIQEQRRSIRTTKQVDGFDSQLWFSVYVGRGISSVCTDEDGLDVLSGSYVVVRAPWLSESARSQTLWSQHCPDYQFSLDQRVDMSTCSVGMLCGRGKLLEVEVWRPPPAVDASEAGSCTQGDRQLIGVGRLSLNHIEEQLSQNLDTPHFQHTDDVASWSDLCRVNDPRSGRCVARIITAINVSRHAPRMSPFTVSQISHSAHVPENLPKGLSCTGSPTSSRSDCRFRLKLTLGRVLHVPEVNEAAAGAVDCLVRYLWPQQAETGELAIRVRWTESAAVVGRVNPSLCHTAVFMYRTPRDCQVDWLAHALSDACAVSAGVRCQLLIRQFHPRQRQTVVAEGVISVSRLVSVLDSVRGDGCQSAVRTFCVPLYPLQERSDPARPVLEVTLTADRLSISAEPRDMTVSQDASHLLLPFSGAVAGHSRGGSVIRADIGNRPCSVRSSVPISIGSTLDSAARISQRKRFSAENTSNGPVHVPTQQRRAFSTVNGEVSQSCTDLPLSSHHLNHLGSHPVHNEKCDLECSDKDDDDDELSVISVECDEQDSIQRHPTTEPRLQDHFPSSTTTCQHPRSSGPVPLSPLPEEVTISSVSSSTLPINGLSCDRDTAATEAATNTTDDTRIGSGQRHGDSAGRGHVGSDNNNSGQTGSEANTHAALLRRIERDLEQFCSSGSIEAPLTGVRMTGRVSEGQSRPEDITADALTSTRITDTLNPCQPPSFVAASNSTATRPGHPGTDVSRLTRPHHPGTDVSRLTRPGQPDTDVSRLTRPGQPDTDVSRLTRPGQPDTDVSCLTRPGQPDTDVSRLTRPGQPDTDVSRLTRPGQPDTDVSRSTRPGQSGIDASRLTLPDHTDTIGSRLTCGSETFRAQLSVLEALHLPRVLSRGGDNGAGDGVDSEVPLVYVSVDTAVGVVQSDSCRSLNPRWNWSHSVQLTRRLLDQECAVLVLKVWHCSRAAVHVLGLVFIDLAPLLHGLDELLGWYNITDLSGLARGQVKLSFRPLDEVSRRRQDGDFMYPSSLSETAESLGGQRNHVQSNNGCPVDSMAAALRHTLQHRPIARPTGERPTSIRELLDSKPEDAAPDSDRKSADSPEAVCLDGTINTLTNLLHRNLADLDGMRVSLVNRSSCSDRVRSLPVRSSLPPLSICSYVPATVNGAAYSSLLSTSQGCTTTAHQPSVQAGRGVPEGGNPEALACSSSPSCRKQDLARNSDINGIC